jgi:hypothetical protein
MADLISILNVRGFSCGRSKVISSEMYFALFMKLFCPIFLVLQKEMGSITKPGQEVALRKQTVCYGLWP